jgi:hypothetical protein
MLNVGADRDSVVGERAAIAIEPRQPASRVGGNAQGGAREDTSDRGPGRAAAGLEAQVVQQLGRGSAARATGADRPGERSQSDAPVVSRAVTVTPEVAAVVGVPVIGPVEALIYNPAARSRCRSRVWPLAESVA